jgi:hypothetical protein
MTELETGIAIGLVTGMIITLVGIKLGQSIREVINDWLNVEEE